MTREQGSIDLPSVFRIDVVPTNSANPAMNVADNRLDVAIVESLKDLIKGQERQNQLLEELIRQMNAGQRQRTQELNQWKSANPQLASSCRLAAEALGRVQSQFLFQITEEVRDNEEHLADGEFMLQEFVDRFGPRLAHLNGVLQVLAQLSGPVSAESGGMD